MESHAASPSVSPLHRYSDAGISSFVSSLSIRGMYKSFGDGDILKGVSLEIASGELFFILGPSGCGKSTLLRIIAGLERADRGTVEMDGRLLDPVPPNQRGIGMVFQNYALWPHMTVQRNVSFGLEVQRLPRSEIRRRTSEALELVRLAEFEHRYPHELSGGQQQRVALARAIVIQPKLILLDEPLSNLDARLRDEIRSELSALHKRLKVTMVYVTHDQEDALVLAHRIAILNRGKVEQLGTPRELYERPVSSFVAQFLGDVNLLPCTVTEYPNESTALLSIPGSAGAVSCTAHVNAKLTDKEAILCVRPELVSGLEPGGGDSAVRLKSIIKEVRYRGSWCDVTLEAAGGLLLSMRAPLSSRYAGVSVGDQVEVGWRVRDGVVLPRG